jgi:hypothetical protein
MFSSVWQSTQTEAVAGQPPKRRIKAANRTDTIIALSSKQVRLAGLKAPPKICIDWGSEYYRKNDRRGGPAQGKSGLGVARCSDRISTAIQATNHPSCMRPGITSTPLARPPQYETPTWHGHGFGPYPQHRETLMRGIAHAA